MLHVTYCVNKLNESESNFFLHPEGYFAALKVWVVVGHFLSIRVLAHLLSFQGSLHRSWNLLGPKTKMSFEHLMSTGLKYFCT